MTNAVECVSGAAVNPNIEFICVTLVILAVVWLFGRIVS